MLENKLSAIQSAGMEDGLIDVIVVQVLVKMYKEEHNRATRKPQENWLLLDEKPWYWDLDLEL